MTVHKVIHFIESAGVYGAEQVLLNLSDEMINDGEYSPVVGCLVSHPREQSDLYDAAVARNIPVLKVVISNSKVLFDLPSAASLLKKENISIVHAHGYKPAIYSYFIGKKINIQVLSTCHLWFKTEQSPLKMRLMIRLEKYLYRWFKKVVGVSEPILDELRRVGLRDDQLELVENGIKIPEVTNSYDKLGKRAELGVSEYDLCIINTARLSKQKGQWNLIHASKRLTEQGVKHKILIVGEGPLKRELTEEIEKNSVGKEVKLLGFRSDISELLMMSDIFALPSVDEGMPISLLEAAALGKPIITTHVGDIHKLITHRKTGLVIEVNNDSQLSEAIIAYANDRSLAKNMGSSAKNKMERDYSVNSMYKKYSEIYRHLLTA